MERIVKQPSAILCSDIHIREDVPVCRTDVSYWDTQWKKIDFISDLQKKHNCPVLHGGDLFDKARPSLNLVRETILHIPNQFFSVAGQHDLVAHSLDLIDKSGLKLLEVAGKITILNRCHWGQEPTEPSFVIKNRNILVWHKMVWQGKKPYPTCTDEPASSILKKYPYSLILCGDNHKTFVEHYEGRVLVNPGSLMRMDADQVDHKPCVFLWYADSNTVQQVFLPIEEGVVSRMHLEQKEERDGRITAFVEKLSGEYEMSLSFEKNLEEFMKVNDVDEEVKQIIYKSIE